MVTDHEKKVFKSSFWYLISNFLVKGIVFLTTPVFSRMLSLDEFGEFSNYTTWLSIIYIVASLSLISSLVRARFDYKNELYGYVKTNLLIGSFFGLIVCIIIFSFSNFFSELFVFDEKYFLILFLYLLFMPAYEMFIEIEKFNYRYKATVFTSVSVAISSVLLSIFLVYIMEDKLLGRIIGAFVPSIVCSVIFYAFFLFQKGKIKFEYAKYALVISIPYIFHLLSGTILNSSDKVMITFFNGAAENAIYSMGYILASIASIVWQSMNSAFSPYLGEKLICRDFSKTKKLASFYLFLFLLIIGAIMLFMPEVLMIMGKEEYMNSKYVVPPIMAGFFMVAVYSCYVNVEQFEKKTLGMSIATIIAAISNVLLNFWLIPIYGCLAAAYTTLFCYFLLFILHFVLVWRCKLLDVYNTKYIVIMITIMLAFSFFMLVLYNFDYLRYVVIFIYFIGSCFFVVKKKTQLLFFLKIKNKK